MHPGALLDLATELLRSVLEFGAPADGVVFNFFRSHRALGPRERRALAEMTYAVLRQRLMFQHFAQSGHGATERRLAILGWQGDAAYLRGVLGPHEIEWLEHVASTDRATLAPKLRHNLPDWLAQPLQTQLGDEFWPLVASLNEPAPLDLRVNALKAKRDDVQAALAGVEHRRASRRRYSPWGLRIRGKPAINKLDVFNRGEIEVQDEGSQLLALLTDAKRGEMVVDFCAGAGGKTLALGAAMRNTGRLYAFDTSGHRLDALKPRLARSGLSNVLPGADRARARRAHQAAGRQDRPRARRRAVFRARHAAAQSRLEVAAIPAGDRRDARQAGRDPRRCFSAAETGRSTGLRDLQPAAAENEAIAAAFGASAPRIHSIACGASVGGGPRRFGR